jgi:hypothetical protein
MTYNFFFNLNSGNKRVISLLKLVSLIPNDDELILNPNGTIDLLIVIILIIDLSLCCLIEVNFKFVVKYNLDLFFKLIIVEKVFFIIFNFFYYKMGVKYIYNFKFIYFHFHFHYLNQIKYFLLYLLLV